MLAFHLTCWLSLQVMGGSASGASPVASGPRHWGQKRLASETASAALPGLERHSTTALKSINVRFINTGLLTLRSGEGAHNPLACKGQTAEKPGVLANESLIAEQPYECDLAKFKLLPPGKRVFIRTLQQINGWRDLPKTISVRIPVQ
jgi:hypothetical protein